MHRLEAHISIKGAHNIQSLFLKTTWSQSQRIESKLHLTRKKEHIYHEFVHWFPCGAEFGGGAGEAAYPGQFGDGVDEAAYPGQRGGGAAGEAAAGRVPEAAGGQVSLSPAPRAFTKPPLRPFSMPPPRTFTVPPPRAAGAPPAWSPRRDISPAQIGRPGAAPDLGGYEDKDRSCGILGGGRAGAAALGEEGQGRRRIWQEMGPI